MVMKYFPPPWVSVSERPHKSEWTYSKGLEVVCLVCPNFTLFAFPNVQYSHGSNPWILSPHSSFCLNNSTRPFSLTWPSLKCQIKVLFDFFSAVAAPPNTVLPIKIYRVHSHSLHDQNDPLSTLIVPFSDLNEWPFDFRVPNEIRFFLRSGTYLIYWRTL